jgi:hypothetical protein
VARWRAASAAVVTAASQQDEAADAALGRRRGDAWPAALARREQRLATLEAARHRLEAQANAAAAAERQPRAAAAAARQRTGPPRRGTARQPVLESPEDKAQSHGTAPERPSMRTNNTGWASGGNAQARVDAAWQSMGACDVTDAPNDTPPAEPRAPATRAPLTQAGMALPQDEAGQAHAIPATLEHGSDHAAAAQALAD